VKTPADKLRAMVDADRLRAPAALEILEEWESVEQWAEALTEIASAIATAKDSIEAYQYAEGRDEKADARDDALTVIEELLGSIMTLDELPDLPNVSETPAMFEIVTKAAS